MRGALSRPAVELPHNQVLERTGRASRSCNSIGSAPAGPPNVGPLYLRRTASVQDQQPIAYEAPGARDSQRQARSRWYVYLAGQLLIAFVVFVGSVIVCAIAGGLIERVIAARFPRYYPSVFATAATQPEFDAVQVGIGTGVGQGAAAGVFVGAIIVLALAIANWRRLRPEV
jgi:hypothetical protein